jgi:ribonuclease H2 subunit A
MQSKFPNIKIVVEEKADGLYKIVGAASIVAKVNRDDLLENHVFDEIGMSRPIEGFGSGYVGKFIPYNFKHSIDHIYIFR